MLKKLRKRIRDPESIFSHSVSILTLQILNRIFGFISTLIVIRHYTKSDYGLMMLTVSLLSVASSTAGSLDESLLRFLPIVKDDEKPLLLGGQFVLKIGLTVMAIVIAIGLFSFFPGGLNIHERDLQNFRLIYSVAVFNIFTICLDDWLYRAFNGLLMYRELLRYTVVGSILNLAACVLAAYLDISIGLCLFSMSLASLIASSFGAVILFKKINFFEFLSYMTPRNGFRVFNQWVKHYSLPLMGISAISILRSRVPNIVLGVIGGAELFGNFIVIRDFYDLLHKTFNNFIGRLYPAIFKIMDRNSGLFLIKTKRILLAGGFFRLFVAISCIFGAPLLFKLYEVSPSKELYFINQVMAFEYFILFFMFIGTFSAMLSKNTMRIFISGAARAVIFGSLTIFLTQKFGVIGATVGAFAGSLISTSFLLTRAQEDLKTSALMRAYVAFGVIFCIIIGFNYAQLQG